MVTSVLQVLSARPAQAESVLAYAAQADMMGAIESDVLADLPTPQRHALDSVLLRTGASGVATDLRVVAAGFVSVVKRLDTSGAGLAGDREPRR
jgi:hypothetical protein